MVKSNSFLVSVLLGFPPSSPDMIPGIGSWILFPVFERYRNLWFFCCCLHSILDLVGFPEDHSLVSQPLLAVLDIGAAFFGEPLLVFPDPGSLPSSLFKA